MTLAHRLRRINRRKNFFQALQALSLTSNLKLCLDPGALDSYDGSSQSWLDLSGTGTTFFKGATSGVEASDPTFAGTAGALGDARFTMDGGDYFRISGGNPTWVQNLHKNNALLTFCGWYKPGADFSGAQAMFGTLINASANNGIQFTIRNTADARVLVSSGSQDLSNISSFTVSANVWTFLGLSIDEAGNVCHMQKDATTETFGGAYAGPTVNNASASLEIGACGNAALPWNANGQIGAVAMWEGTALSSTELTSIYQATRQRYGV